MLRMKNANPANNHPSFPSLEKEGRQKAFVVFVFCIRGIRIIL
ncbi:MAG: hypothetical protein UY50_C0012G0008 [Parcubacteria group bacterium GW2011_GWA2_49_9]|nr:MAG: hypothetical protein UY50_C0012G0008 [Parcubacteria group bacterium GW2011_GWA2_49_9]